MGPLLFSTIDVTRQAFYRTSLSAAIVNLKPIVPGHVLVIPTRPAVRLADLTQEELSALFSAVQKVGKAVETAYKADALTIALQDGKAAGQSISHVHVHVLPRHFKGDRFEGVNDEIYPAIEQSEEELPHHLRARGTKDIQSLKVDAGDNRQPRTLEEMEKETLWLTSFISSA
ncbi:HIT-like domain-containing protein [Gautieria morchelliformis]|nr:HIT-like domain-containing protein [Gautieria morchelliformis]